MGTPKSSILVGIPIINHPFWGTPILGNLHIGNLKIIHQIRRCFCDVMFKIPIGLSEKYHQPGPLS